MKKICLLPIFIVSILFPTELFGWGMTGHRVIAEIAQKNIKKGTNKKVNKLLDCLPMAYWANWPDFIKSDQTGEWDHTHIWHYVNAPGDLSRSDFVSYIKDIEQDNLYSVIPRMANILRSDTASDEDKRIALIFLIHLVGDAHQPMHVGREEDLGGNKVTLTWFRSPTNLHAVWDGKLIEYEKYSYSEYAGILNVLPKSVKKDMQRGSLEQWLYESHQLANDIYRDANIGDDLTYEYNYKYKYTIEAQLQKAGLRLAAMLDMIFK